MVIMEMPATDDDNDDDELEERYGGSLFLCFYPNSANIVSFAAINSCRKVCNLGIKVAHKFCI